jgi:hypothetical protein
MEIAGALKAARISGEAWGLTMASKLEEVSGLIKATGWPLVSLLALLLFAQPLRRLVDTLSGEQFETIKLGGLELNIRASDLPRLSGAVGTALAGLPERQMVILLQVSPTSSQGYCRGIGNADSSFDTNTSAPIRDLEKRGLVSVKEQKGYSETCGDELMLRLTDLGVNARGFVVQLVAAQLKSAEPTAKLPS